MKILILTSLLFVSLAQAKTHLPTHISTNDIRFEQCDSFLLRYGFIIKVVEIGWYAPKCKIESILDSKNKILRFHYFKDVKASFFIQSAEEFFIKNLTAEQKQENLITALKQFNAGYTEIKSGEYFQIEHFNESQISLFRNDELLASAENSELANNYFNIWFGKQPVIDKLKDAFLGN